MLKKIEKVLIANRGEIAVRIIKACREMGIATVAVYSEVDRTAAHVLAADQAIFIGPPAPLESYLNMDKLTSAAKESGAQAIHPGYGFLSENAEFARKCRQAGIIFIGPSAEAMEKVGDKISARETMTKAGIPMTRGVEIHGSDWNKISADAAEIGFPVMVKAAAGGGGKGMRVVRKADELKSAIEAGRREALSAFGNDDIFMEKFVEKPRHIEFQVLADHHGNTIHLFERECSIQRRHQKIIEESPSVALTPELRQEMGQAACRVVQAVDYHNAGTVEFLLDADNNYYFLEVNARIQVEHPVTEMVTGVDLVKEQIRVARGEKLTLKQEDLQQRGHAIECRIYAEDAGNNFFPATGTLHWVEEPAGPGIRVDSGIYSGMEVTHFYDPILSKLICYGATRQEALEKMDIALSQYVLLGVKTSLVFLRELINHPSFIEGDVDTGFIKKHFDGWTETIPAELLHEALAVAALPKKPGATAGADADQQQKPMTPWQAIGDWQMLSDS